MDPFQLMEKKKAGFTQNDLLIYESMISNPNQLTYKSISRLAEDCGVSQPAISRFVKNLGYSRYQDFRAEVISTLALRSEQQAQGTDHLVYFHTLYQVLGEAEKVLTLPVLQDLVQFIAGFDRVYTTGMSKSYHPAMLMEILMRKNHYDFHAVPIDMLDDLGNVMSENDLLIVFSVSGTSQVIPLALRTTGKILLITTNSAYSQERPGDRTVVLPYVTTDPETSSISPVIFDIFVELLVSYFGR